MELASSSYKSLPKFKITIARTLAVIIVFLFFSLGGNTVAYNFYSPFLLAHYIMAIIFLLNIKKIASKGNRYIASLVGLTVLSILLTHTQSIDILI